MKAQQTKNEVPVNLGLEELLESGPLAAGWRKGSFHTLQSVEFKIKLGDAAARRQVGSLRFGVIDVQGSVDAFGLDHTGREAKPLKRLGRVTAASPGLKSGANERLQQNRGVSDRTDGINWRLNRDMKTSLNNEPIHFAGGPNTLLTNGPTAVLNQA